MIPGTPRLLCLYLSLSSIMAGLRCVSLLCLSSSRLFCGLHRTQYQYRSQITVKIYVQCRSCSMVGALRRIPRNLMITNQQQGVGGGVMFLHDLTAISVLESCHFRRAVRCTICLPKACLNEGVTTRRHVHSAAIMSKVQDS